MNQAFLETQPPDRIQVDVVKVEEIHDVGEHEQAVEMDEMWSYSSRDY